MIAFFSLHIYSKMKVLLKNVNWTQYKNYKKYVQKGLS